ncbi:uncharacterized protein LOC122672505 [Telopea speciosissima]|uniref:uncharacterized protein LOC122672505 n=1 Tax=Telopea speciosissima TaxID=54955 RepID=UPI001CC34243|nr:uncharacterized protein LOC122672505 [Telopea speciosissima]
MPADHLSRQGKQRRTPLHIAASGGNLEIVMAIVDNDDRLVTKTSIYYDGSIPIIIAAKAGNKDVVDYLYPITIREKGFLKTDSITTATFLTSLIFGDFYGEALDLLQKYPDLVLFKDIDGVTAMDALSRKPSAFKSSFPTIRSGIGTLEYYFQNFMYSLLDVHVGAENACWHTRRDVKNSFDANGESSQVPGCKHIYEEKLKHYKASVLLKEVWRLVSKISDLGHVDVEDVVVAAMFQATQNGIEEFIKEMINYCPQLISQFYPNSEVGSNYEGQTIFH